MKKSSAKFLVLGALALAFLSTNANAAATALVTSTKLIRAGVTATAATIDATNGNKVYLLTDGIVVKFTNIGATSTTVTATDQFTNPEGYTNNATIPVHSGQSVYVGPFKKSRWADSSGYLNFTYAGLTTTTVETYRLPIGEPDAQTK